jgi:hypothetical protein
VVEIVATNAHDSHCAIFIYVFVGKRSKVNDCLDRRPAIQPVVLGKVRVLIATQREQNKKQPARELAGISTQKSYSTFGFGNDAPRGARISSVLRALGPLALRFRLSSD